MQLLPDTATSATIIADLSVNVPAPFAEGHPLSDAEAKVLNQVFKENISNNMRGKFKKIIEKFAGDKETAAVEAQESLDAYIASYSFGVRVSTGGSSKGSPLERRMLRLATARVSKAIKANNLEVTAEKKAELIHNLLANANHNAILKAQAEAELAQEQEAAKDVISLDDLGLSA